MPRKTPPSPGSDAKPVAGTHANPPAKLLVDLLPKAPDTRAKDGAESASQLTQVQVRVESIEELDRSQRMLSKAIKLAIAVADARPETVSAWGSLREILRDPSEADRTKWETLTEILVAIRPPESWPSNDADLSESLTRSVERFRQARELACEEAERITDSLLLGDSDPGQGAVQDMVALRRATKELQEAVNECAKACENESQKHVDQIRHRVRAILEQLERQHESASKPTDSAQQRFEAKTEPTAAAFASNRELTKVNDEDDLEDPYGRS